MARDILSEYGKDSGAGDKPRATSGGVTSAKDLPYSPPQGPKGMGHQGPGLGGDNYGNGQQPVCREDLYGNPGIGGTNKGNRGSQR